jgi:hypothetical protein
VRTPPEPARSLDQPPPGSIANYKDWNREPASLELHWSKAFDGTWCSLGDVAPEQLVGHGVFVIWRKGGATAVSGMLYVGRGSLRDAFGRCLHDPIFRAEGLHITWATVNDPRMLDSVAAYLYQKLRPMWGEAVYAPSMPVNLPLTA